MPPSILRSRALALLACAASGLLIMLHAPRADLFFLGWVALVPLCMALAFGPGGLGAALLYGWVAGIAAHAAGFSWIVGTVQRFGHLPAAAAAAAFALLCLAGGLAWGVIALATKLLARARAPLPVALALSVVIVESWFPHLFPWQIAMGHHRVPLALQTADLWGVEGVSGLLALAGGVIFEKIAANAGWLPDTRARRRTRVATAALLCLALLYGAVRIGTVDRAAAAAPKLRVGIVQPNVSMDEKRDPSTAMRQLWLMQSLSANLEGRGAEMIVWPESSYPFRVPREATVDFAGSRRIMAHTRVPLIVGALSHGDGKVYNSAYLVTPGGKLIGPSDKIELVLLSEHNPFARIVPAWLARRFPAAASPGITPGAGVRLLSYGRLRAGVLNCYEDTLPGVTRRVARAGANLLVNVTNDAWFGDTAEPWQHLALAVLRSVENRRFLVRSVNTGVSASVDPAGRIAYESGTFVQDLPVVEARLMEGTTLFTAAGNWIGWLSLFVYLAVIVAAVVRKRRLVVVHDHARCEATSNSMPKQSHVDGGGEKK